MRSLSLLSSTGYRLQLCLQTPSHCGAGMPECRPQPEAATEAGPLQVGGSRRICEWLASRSQIRDTGCEPMGALDWPAKLFGPRQDLQARMCNGSLRTISVSPVHSCVMAPVLPPHVRTIPSRWGSALSSSAIAKSWRCHTQLSSVDAA